MTDRPAGPRARLFDLVHEWRERSAALRTVCLSKAGLKTAYEIAGLTEALDSCAYDLEAALAAWRTNGGDLMVEKSSTEHKEVRAELTHEQDTRLVHPSPLSTARAEEMQSTWGEGPWTTEPDRVEWEHAGLPCLALRNHHGIWCGYAAVPPCHPLHGKHYDDLDVSVHGGLTYASACSHRSDGVAGICHTPQPGEPDDVWWFGFDCAHGGDFVPALHARTRGLGTPFSDEPYDHARAVAARRFDVDEYRTLDYVQAETNSLADQLAAIPAIRRPAWIRRHQ